MQQHDDAKQRERREQLSGRRAFLIRSSKLLFGAPFALSGVAAKDQRRPQDTGALKLFLGGDVMTGRGIDQILPHSVDPRLHETYVKDARQYVELAEEAHGPIPDDVAYDYVWGDALEELARVAPDVRIVNLETAVTTSDDWWSGKGIHYRMHPKNVDVLRAAGLDVCILGNNHVVDWGRSGLRETLRVLQEAGLRTPGAGLDHEAASAPAALDTDAGRLLVFSYGSPTAGVPRAWRAEDDRSGVNLLPDLSPQTTQEVVRHIRAHRREGDRVVVSIHWGPNWGYDVPTSQRTFAHHLIDAGAADIIYGHSSHHPKGIEVYHGRPILYGCGDLLNDYEGIRGRERFRSELTLMYFPTLDRSGALVSFEMAPMRVYRFQLQRASTLEARWLARMLDRESRPFGARVERSEQGRLALNWS